MTATGTFIFICSACGYKARLPEEFSGRTIKCPGCQAAQLAKAQVNTERKTASFTRVAATPVPFTLPKEQEDALARPETIASVPPPAAPPATAPKAFPSPLPGAIQVTSDRIARKNTPQPEVAAAKPAAGGTIDFACSACHARMRLPAHYEGKSILCPKCSAPQRVQTTLPEPMDTTRAVTREGDRPGAATSGATSSGARQAVRVTPLPRTYPTPLPSPLAASSAAAITPNQPPPPVVGSGSVGSLTTSPVAATPPTEEPTAEPAADSMAGMTMAISAPASSVPTPAAPAAEADLEIGSGTSEFSKPHPSRGKVPTVAIRKSTAPTGSASQQPAAVAHPRTPTGLIIATGLLGLMVIGLGAGLIWHVLALSDARTRLATAETAATAAAHREQESSAKLAAQVAELELKLAAEKAKAAEVPKPVEPTPPAEVAPVVPPAEAKPVDPAPAPTPAAP